MKSYPNFDDKIIIVGAGIGGIDMARRLQDEGFQNVTILEKENRVGGQTYTYRPKWGGLHDMGTIFILQTYSRVRGLIKKYLPKCELNPPEGDRTIVHKDMNFLSIDEWTKNILSTVFGSILTMYKMIKYIDLWNEYYELNEYFFPDLKSEQLRKINMTFEQFLDKHNLKELKPLAFLVLTAQGYGQLDEMPAFYGMYMFNKDLIYSYILQLATGQKVVEMLDCGIQRLYEKIVDKENLHVLLNHEVTSIKRGGKGKGIEVMCNGKKMVCDFLIMDTGFKVASKLMNSFTNFEKIVLHNSIIFFTVVVLIKLEKAFDYTNPIYYFIDNIRNDTGVYEIRFSDFGTKRGKYILLYMHDKDYRNIVQKFMDKYFKVKYKIEHVFKSEALQHYTPQLIQKNILKKILKNQGSSNTWYIGGSVCFNALEMIVGYNEQLIDIMNKLKYNL